MDKCHETTGWHAVLFRLRANRQVHPKRLVPDADPEGGGGTSPPMGSLLKVKKNFLLFYQKEPFGHYLIYSDFTSLFSLLASILSPFGAADSANFAASSSLPIAFRSS